MSEEELIKETMMLDYSQLVMNNVYCHKEIERLNNIINEAIKYIYNWLKGENNEDIISAMEKLEIMLKRRN